MHRSSLDIEARMESRARLSERVQSHSQTKGYRLDGMSYERTEGASSPYLLPQSKGKYWSTVRWSHSYVTSLNKTRLYDGSLESTWRIATIIFIIGQEVWCQWVLTNSSYDNVTWTGMGLPCRCTRGLHVNGFHCTCRIIYSWPGWWPLKAGSFYVDSKSVTKLF